MYPFPDQSVLLCLPLINIIKHVYIYIQTIYRTFTECEPSIKVGCANSLLFQSKYASLLFRFIILCPLLRGLSYTHTLVLVPAHMTAVITL